MSVPGSQHQYGQTYDDACQRSDEDRNALRTITYKAIADPTAVSEQSREGVWHYSHACDNCGSKKQGRRVSTDSQVGDNK
ncbi:hypothetical protein [Agreia sp. COWG]|uniref:hypothetical protein n=1 Tax=Agreia sp. COWG TaxID=2773266 RepID=UPI001927EF95|nr:hypothetical protein [Agreia sp. COWG]